MAQLKGIIVDRRAGLRVVCDDGTTKTIGGYGSGQQALIVIGDRVEGTINGGALDSLKKEVPEGIDPPYKGDGGMGYRHSSKMIDYKVLAEWVKTRKGEVICCEGLNGDYLPFETLLDLKGVAGKVSKELIYYRTDFKSDGGK